MKSVPSLSLAVVLSLAACNAGSAPSEAAQPAIEAHVQDVDPDAEKPAERTAETPTLQVKTLDGADYSLAAHRGKWVVVNFWATWCKPCLKEIPDLSAFDAARDDVRVIGLAYEEIEAADMRAFLQKHPAGYPIALLDVYDPPADFETPRGLPMTYLIDPEGRVAKKYLGPITSEMLSADIAAAGG